MRSGVARAFGAAQARVADVARRPRRSPFSDLRRLEPVSRVFGFDRGLPVDRWYIEHFLERCGGDIKGSVLEFGDDQYTRRFGRPETVDVLNVDKAVPGTTVAGDLARPDDLPRERYDCVICTQTLQFVFDVRAAVAGIHRMLKPDGVVLCTVPGISQISRYDMDRWGDYWRFTSLSARVLFERAFGRDVVRIQAFGNVLASVSFLEGIAADELKPDELEHHDDDYEVIVAVRATRQ